MPALKRQLPEIIAEHLDGGVKSYAIKNIDPKDLRACRNIRANDKGGRFPRPGYQDSGVDLSSYAFTAGRGIFSANFPEKLWFAGDDGSNVKICYVDTDQQSDFYQIAYDVGLTLQTGYYVTMMEFWGNIYYGNGYDTAGRIITAEVDTGGVLAGATELNLKPGRGVWFPSSGTGRIGTDTFTWGGKTGDQLTGVSGILAHDAGELVTTTATLSPNYCDKATILFEWFASLNLLGDPEQPFTWEFSKFSNAGTPANFYDFSGSPSSQEIVGEGGEITAGIVIKNFAIVWKKDRMYTTPESSVNTSNGSRIPKPNKKGFGAVNQRCVAPVSDDGVAWLTPENRVVYFGPAVQDGQETISVDTEFDKDIQDDLRGCDKPGPENWVHFNAEQELLKVAVFKQGVRYVWVKDMKLGEWFLDSNKNFDVVCQHQRDTWAFDGMANKLYIDETGNYDDDIPVDSDWLTGRLGNPAFYTGKARYVRMSGYMTMGSIAYVDFYKDDEYQFTKTLTDEYVTRSTSGTPVGSGGIGRQSTGSGGPVPDAFPFRFPFGANHRGEDFSIKVRIDGTNGDFVQFDDFRIGVRPLSRYPHKHA